jgi:hypothetical protein
MAMADDALAQCHCPQIANPEIPDSWALVPYPMDVVIDEMWVRPGRDGESICPGCQMKMEGNRCMNVFCIYYG